MMAKMREVVEEREQHGLLRDVSFFTNLFFSCKVYGFRLGEELSLSLLNIVIVIMLMR
jgi:hypothetical protein